MTNTQLKKIEKLLNKALRKNFYISKDSNYNDGDVDVWNICVNILLNDLRVEIKTDRKIENIIKIDSFYQGTRHHIFINRHTFDVSCASQSGVWFKNNNRLLESKKYIEKLKNFDNDAELYTYTISIVR